MKPDQGIQDEEAGLVLSDCGLEPLAIIGPVQAQGVGRDRPQRQLFQLDAVMKGERFEALADRRCAILGGIEQDRPGGRHREAAQTGCAGGHGNGHLHGQP